MRGLLLLPGKGHCTSRLGTLSKRTSSHPCALRDGLGRDFLLRLAAWALGIVRIRMSVYYSFITVFAVALRQIWRLIFPVFKLSRHAIADRFVAVSVLCWFESRRLEICVDVGSFGGRAAWSWNSGASPTWTVLWAPAASRVGAAALRICSSRGGTRPSLSSFRTILSSSSSSAFMRS